VHHVHPAQVGQQAQMPIHSRQAGPISPRTQGREQLLRGAKRVDLPSAVSIAAAWRVLRTRPAGRVNVSSASSAGGRTGFMSPSPMSTRHRMPVVQTPLSPMPSPPDLTPAQSALHTAT
jgi:hypothetical protein